MSDTETYPYYLRAILPDAEVINFGVHGYENDQMLILLKEEGLKYRPDIILIGFFGDDISRNVLAFRTYAKPKFILQNGQLRLTASPGLLVQRKP